MIRIPFVKMQGAGNDYVYLDCTRQPMQDLLASLTLPALARRLSNRHYGIGSDGLVLILSSSVADLQMRMFNADGSEAEMCGNAARCVGKYAYEHGLVGRNVITLETHAGIRQLTLNIEENRVQSVAVNMGKPQLLGQVILPPENIKGLCHEVYKVSMGNPHAVFFMEEPVEEADLQSIAASVSAHPSFPEGANVEIVNLLSAKEVNMRVWERGAGETLACGTGACAVAAAAQTKKKADRQVTIQLPGGALMVSRQTDGSLVLTGPAQEVFIGEYLIQKVL